MRKFWILTAMPVMAMGLWACDVEQTEEGEMPEVDVRGGNLPEYEVDGPEVDVRTERQTVTVPDVDVSTEERTIEVPTIDVTPGDASQDAAEERAEEMAEDGVAPRPVTPPTAPPAE